MVVSQSDSADFRMSAKLSIGRHFIARVATLGLATFLSALLSLLLLPIATKILHASDYGTFALLMSVATLISSAMDGGSSLFLPAVYSGASLSERGRMFTTAAAVASAGGIAISALVIGAEQYLDTALFEPAVPLDAMIIAAALVPLRSVATITTVVFSITNRSHIIAMQTILHASSVFVCTIVALFWLSLGGTSLIFGAACGQFATLAVGLIALYQYGELPARPSRQWARQSLRHTLTSSTFGFVGGAHSFAENSLLASARGLEATGFLNHARVYYNFTIALVTTVAVNVRAISLDEARYPVSNFESTQKAWTSVHLALTGIGILFALFGAHIVNFISNGKLNDAAPYIPFFIITVLIQNMNQAATAVIYASGKAHVAVRFQIALTLLGLVVLYPMIRSFGIAGIVGVILAETILYRITIAHLARTLRRIRFQDAAAYFGCVLVAATALWVDSTLPSSEARIIWLLGSLFLTAFVGRRSLAEAIAEIKRLTGL